MAVCERCGIDKPEDAFRHKTSGPRTGYRFPNCIECEQEQADAQAAEELQTRGFDVVQPDPAKVARIEADRVKLATAKAEAEARVAAERAELEAMDPGVASGNGGGTFDP